MFRLSMNILKGSFTLIRYWLQITVQETLN